MFRISARIVGGFSDRRVNQAREKINQQIPVSLTRIARDAEKMLKRDYLKRGGSFTRTKNPGRSRFGRREKTKTSGYAWVKNPGNWLRWGTGALARSWIHVNAIKVRGGWQSRIVSREPVRYARIHEFGGMAGRNHSVRIPKRPYLQPMMDDNMPKWRGWLGDDLRAIFR